MKFLGIIKNPFGRKRETSNQLYLALFIYMALKLSAVINCMNDDDSDFNNFIISDDQDYTPVTLL